MDFDRKNLQEIMNNTKDFKDDDNPIKASIGGSLGNHSKYR